MNPVDRAKNAFDDYDGYEFGMNNTLHSNTISEQTLNDVRDYVIQFPLTNCCFDN